MFEDLCNSLRAIHVCVNTVNTTSIPRVVLKYNVVTCIIVLRACLNVI